MSLPDQLSLSLRLLLWLAIATPLAAQPEQTSPPEEEPASEHEDHSGHGSMTTASGWHFMQDGVLFGTYSHQDGPRGSSDFKSQNWWMGMAMRNFSSGSSLTFNTMFTIEPVTVGKRGYALLFQVGETYQNLPLVDRQHSHDLFMQLSAVYRHALGDNAGLTIAGGPSGEPALGPVAFMHRQSAAENPMAPLSHHTMDSTHVAMGVITAAVDVGPLMLEGSVFRGREPDENRWDLDLGALDSWAARLWYRPSPSWEFQVSHGFLKQPEALEVQDNDRTRASVAWSRQNGDDFTAAMFAFGRNVRDFSDSNVYVFEATHRFSRNTLYTRAERVELETEHLLFPGFIHVPHPQELIDPLDAITIGGVRDLVDFKGLNLGLGGDVVFYRVPERLQSHYGESPKAYHLFLRLRLPANMGRMWGMTMARPMRYRR